MFVGKIIDFYRPTTFLSGVIVYSVIYGVLMYALAMNEFEKNTFLKPIRKIVSIPQKNLINKQMKQDMIHIDQKKDCCGCSACDAACNKKCISMTRDEDGFLYPIVDVDQCVNCGLCQRVCPMANYQVPKRKPLALGAINQNDDIRRMSSSGGVFYLLCEYVIQQNGIVFGAAFDENFDVYHTYSEDLDGCKRFMGSKYVQSIIGDSYQKAKQFLQEDRIVLFTGTPCQIAGLLSYLGNLKDHEKLITQDIVCLGAPSPYRWHEFKKRIQGNKEITSIQFRNKETGWRSGSFVAVFYDGSEYKELYAQTDYMKGFSSGAYTRPSCYECKFSRLERQSDITLGDFWGVEGLYPELYDNKGTSLVLVNSKKGRQIIKNVSKGLTIKKVRLDYAVKYNPAASNREQLFRNCIS